MNKYTNIAKFALHSKSILPTRTASFSGENGGFTPTVRSNNSVRRTQVSQKFPFRVIKAGRIIDRQHFFVFLTNKGGYRKNGQGVVLTKKSEDLCKSSKPSIADFLDGKDVTLSIRKGNEGGSVRLDVYYNRAESIAYAQLYEFSNYTYEPATDIVELHGDRADKLIMSIQ